MNNTAMDSSPDRELSPEEMNALIEFAKRHGRCWKSDLRDLWERGYAGEILQFLRNASYFGPYGLVWFRLPEVVGREERAENS